MARPFSVWLFTLLLSACATAPSTKPTIAVSPPIPVEDWCERFNAMLTDPLSAERALFGFNGRFGFLENPQEGETGIGRAVFNFASGPKVFLDGAVQLGVITEPDRSLHFLLPGDPPMRQITCTPQGYLEHAESGPFVLDVEVRFLDKDVALLSAGIVSTSTATQPATVVIRSRTVNDGNPKSVRYVQNTGLLVSYNQPSPAFQPSQSVYVACLPRFAIDKGHCTNESYIGGDIALRDRARMTSLYWTQRGRAAGYLIVPALELEPLASARLSLILAASTDGEEEAWALARAWAERLSVTARRDEAVLAHF